MTPREAAIEQFLSAGAWKGAQRRPFAHDASFRRYFRLSGGPKPALLMDAPPPQENVRPWCKIARHLDHPQGRFPAEGAKAAGGVRDGDTRGLLHDPAAEALQYALHW